MTDRWSDLLAVTLRRGQWAVVLAAASSYDTRVPREQGDGGECLDAIRRVVERPVEERGRLVELCAADVHDRWVETKRSQGVTSRLAEDGTEQMVPYDELPEHIKDLDRGSVAATVDALAARGLLKEDPGGTEPCLER